ncbi:E3 ubiquitin-protein ligase TRIM39-like [Acanthopagrus latus]|uniref:E3 ubiquitin-protein ligase TRIM39-like n=1 Tax=Acanthopagrus latus TaxID=8177 RepID=UPI00187C4B66|nr:E3 ubiquitin-protein ligase TRIM39-like [Acanthopagrus latus]
MASKSEENLRCPVCQDVFKDPVLLSCSHSFCKDCVQRWWRRKQTLRCPVCKRTSSRKHPPLNLALKNLCEAFLLERDQRSSDALCSLHSENLKLFCVDHQEPVCLVCRDSEKHADHRFRPVDEAAREHREELQKCLKPLQDKLKLLKEAKRNCNRTSKQIKARARDAKRQIRKEFKRLHRVLEEEEEVRVAALRKEEKQKRVAMKQKAEALHGGIAALSGTIRAAAEEMRAEDVAFLQNYKAALERVQQRPLMDDPEPLTGALIDLTMHLGNLSFKIWKKMKDAVHHTTVILDPSSAHPELVLSDDLTSVRSRGRQELPDDPERFHSSCFALGSVGFKPGQHSWVVEVGDSAHWVLGVAPESPQKKGDVDSNYHLLAIGFYNGTYKAIAPNDQVYVLPVKKQLQRIRVQMDYSCLSFFDPDKLIRMVPHTYRERLFPYIATRDKLPLTILPDTPDIRIFLPNTTSMSDDDDDNDNDDDDDDDDHGRYESESETIYEFRGMQTDYLKCNFKF